MWYKEVDGVRVYATNRVMIGDAVIFNPTDELLKEAGFIEEAPKVKSKEELLVEAKAMKIAEVEVYDQSETVNSFYLNGTPFWLDRETRVGLMHSTARLKYLGKPETTLWLNGAKLTLNCDAVIGMLSQLEEYALKCFDTTEEHKAKIKNLTSVEEINAYDYKINYPEKLNFKTS